MKKKRESNTFVNIVRRHWNRSLHFLFVMRTLFVLCVEKPNAFIPFNFLSLKRSSLVCVFRPLYSMFVCRTSYAQRIYIYCALSMAQHEKDCMMNWWMSNFFLAIEGFNRNEKLLRSVTVREIPVLNESQNSNQIRWDLENDASIKIQRKNSFLFVRTKSVELPRCLILMTTFHINFKCKWNSMREVDFTFPPRSVRTVIRVAE